MAQPQPIPNATNERQIDHLEEVAQREEQERLEALRTVLRDYQGRRALWDLLTVCGVFRTVFDPDPQRMAFRAGQQDLGHRLQADLISIDDQLYDRMAREARARAKRSADVTRAVLLREVPEGDERIE